MATTTEKPQKSERLATFLAVVACVLLIGAVFWLNTLGPDPAEKSEQDQTPALILPVQPENVEGRYLFSGTVVMARAVERTAAGDYEQPFGQFATFKPEQYDGWLADLECPMTTKNISYQQQVSNLIFNCRPEWLPTLKKHFTMFNLANNHTDDLGAAGFLETVEAIESAGIQTVGSYDPSNSKDACEVMALPVRVIKSDDVTDKGTLPVAYCAFHYFGRKPVQGEMDIVSEYAKVMPVFGLMHAGVEYRPNSDATQQQVAHTLIDNGSEFVIGNSPHWVQESEVYRDKPIFYSTGNFIFDQIDPEEQRGLSIDVNMSLEYDENVGKWLALGEKCKQRADNCLELAQQQELKKVTLDLKYQPVGSSGGSRRLTQLADPPLQKSIEERLRWSATKQALGQ